MNGDQLETSIESDILMDSRALSLQMEDGLLKLTEPAPSILTLPLPLALLARDECPPVQESEGAIIPQEFCMQAETLGPTHPGHKEALCFLRCRTYTLMHSPTCTQSEGLIQGVKGFIDTLVKRVFGTSVVCVIAHQEKG